MMTLNQYRAEYRKVRAITCRLIGMSFADFDTRATDYAHEAADGEEMRPCHFYQGATEFAYLKLGAKVYDKEIRNV